MNNKLSIENARLIFRNFRGAETKYSRAGTRSFCVVLDPEQADKLSDLGWNVRQLDPRDEGDEPLYYISVKLNYYNSEPRVYMVTKNNKTLLHEDTVGMLDDVDISTADIIINPYHWEVNGKKGIAAYVKTMYVNIEEDEFASKYNFEDRTAYEDEIPF